MCWYHVLYLSLLSAHPVLSHLGLRQSPTSRSFSPVQESHEFVEATQKRQASSIFLNDKTKEFAVNGTSLPEVDFDVGESYAGLLPIGDANDPNQLYFWFFPSTNPAAAKEITIWLTGGPGCASSGELMQENGPFIWAPGTFKPVKNDWSWHKLTNMVWIDQPVGSGFSQGTVTAKDEFDVARQFMGFWKNFIDTFSMQGYTVYVTGSSYSGMYSPYISSAMLDANDTTYFDVRGMQVWDGSFNKNILSEDIPAAAFVNTFEKVLTLNSSFTESIRSAAQTCGYTDYINKYLVYPATSQQPATLPGQDANNTYLPGCNIFDNVYTAAQAVNPCFSPYSITNRCPLKLDPIGFSDGYQFVPPSFGPVYLDRADVKAAIHAPENYTWVFCSSFAGRSVFVNGTDNSLLGGPASQPVLPNVIDRTQNVIIGHGSQDFVLIANATLMMIQNITFGGKLGFQSRPSEPLVIPYQGNANPESMAGGGVAGIVHTERGLTFLEVELSGHFLTADAPAVAFRSLEVLLGRVDGFASTQAFTNVANASAQVIVAAMQGNANNAANISSESTKTSGGSGLSTGGLLSWAGVVGVLYTW